MIKVQANFESSSLTAGKGALILSWCLTIYFLRLWVYMHLVRSIPCPVVAPLVQYIRTLSSYGLCVHFSFLLVLWFPPTSQKSMVWLSRNLLLHVNKCALGWIQGLFSCLTW